MRQKNNIRILKQGISQTDDDFAKALEAECERLAKELKAVTPSISVMTADQHGRLTATIQIITDLEEPADKPLFDFQDLAEAYRQYTKDVDNKEALVTTNHYQDYLIRLKRGDLYPY